MDRRPRETKPLCDHTTALCHLCEAAKTNFTTIVKALKRLCVCGTNMCPNWDCVCPPTENADESDKECDCPGCECELCTECEVSKIK